jgi:uncharacterized protein
MMLIAESKRKIILDRLREIEEKYSVKIVYACESGSRAWGFPSADSDYDVRFIYLHPTQWYLSIKSGRDVIEEPILDEFDINGWDLRKALGLLHKSNPPLLEWLGSPIVYLEDSNVVQKIRSALPLFYSHVNCFSHYLHMAERNFREYLKGETVRTKKYFYVLRPVLAMQWIEQELGLVPTDFNILVQQLVKDPVLLNDIQNLLKEKMSGAELQEGKRIDSISTFIESEIERLLKIKRVKEDQGPVSVLDDLFQSSLLECWG